MMMHLCILFVLLCDSMHVVCAQVLIYVECVLVLLLVDFVACCCWDTMLCLFVDAFACVCVGGVAVLRDCILILMIAAAVPFVILVVDLWMSVCSIRCLCCLHAVVRCDTSS